MPLLADVVLEQLVALEFGVFFGAVLACRIVHLNGRHVHVHADAAMAEPLISVEIHVVAVVGHNLLDPGVHVGRFVEPRLHDAHIVLPAEGLTQHVVQLDGVNFLARLGALGNVHRAVPVAGGAHRAGFFSHDEVDAEIGCIGGRGHARIAGADDEQLGVHRVHDVARGDVGRASQPIGGRRGVDFRSVCRGGASCVLA